MDIHGWRKETSFFHVLCLIRDFEYVCAPYVTFSFHSEGIKLKKFKDMLLLLFCLRLLCAGICITTPAVDREEGKESVQVVV